MAATVWKNGETAVEVDLVGVHRVNKKLASGDIATYYYAWRGGPRIHAKPNTKAFIAEYFKLTRHREDTPYQGKLAEIIKEYVNSPAYQNLKPSTKEGYDIAIRAIEAEFFDMPSRRISAHGTRSIFLQWRDEIAATHPRKADLFMSVLQRILAFAYDREMISRHPLEKVEKISDGTRRDLIWTDDEIAVMRFGKKADGDKPAIKPAPEPIVRAMMLALWTGQRQGDLLKITWSAYDGESLSLRQGKTGAHVRVKVSEELKAILDHVKRGNAVTILTNAQGKPWATGFKSSWRKAVEKAGIRGKTFHDLRGTFVTLAYRNGASIKQIAEVSGHSEKDAEAIIRKHYLVSSAAVDSIEKSRNSGLQGT
ncbi:tyrosine-type recombinase/integrase [Brucella pseudintermedia]|uniref:tyrosine-type recombinase/integrase n=1 Tax=Brucella pseudintermedia TaxID=370111 RepID=UPI003670598E|nr:tyrosine-type recombinase/integrase [Brucella pseudintermedia]